jgi:hypothetical protein
MITRAVLEEAYVYTPWQVMVNGVLMIITDPMGEHDFALNASAGDIGTLDGYDLSQVLDTAASRGRTVLLEFFVYPLREPSGLVEGPVQVLFDWPELDGLQWRLERLDSEEEDWELVAECRVN